jgi:hypothetical protein
MRISSSTNSSRCPILGQAASSGGDGYQIEAGSGSQVGSEKEERFFHPLAKTKRKGGSSICLRRSSRPVRRKCTAGDHHHICGRIHVQPSCVDAVKGRGARLAGITESFLRSGKIAILL